MTKSRQRRWGPTITGNLEISCSKSGVFIGGDPDGLRSLANLLVWLAEYDQESVPGMPDGERYHVHLHRRALGESYGTLSRFSEETEVCRLDAKGTGEFPEKYRAAPRKKKRG